VAERLALLRRGLLRLRFSTTMLPTGTLVAMNVHRMLSSRACLARLLGAVSAAETSWDDHSLPGVICERQR
jgi:hypothetical protein